MTEHDVAVRHKVLDQGAGGSWVGREENWSLGGNQGKFALALRDAVWCSCQGSAATTHIFKNGMLGFELQALNEYACMKTALACGIPTSHVDYRHDEDEPALVVERYDRVRDSSGVMRRPHRDDGPSR